MTDQKTKDLSAVLLLHLPELSSPDALEIAQKFQRIRSLAVRYQEVENSVSKTKKKKFVADAIAGWCAETYYRNTSLKPTVSNKQVPHSQGTASQAYGPFLSFVEGVFEAMGVAASAEAFARKAAKEFEPKS